MRPATSASTVPESLRPLLRGRLQRHVDRNTVRSRVLPGSRRASSPSPASRADREQELEEAIVEGLAPFRAADGSYRFSNEYHFLLARA